MDDIGLEIWESSRVLCQYIQDNESARRLIGSVPGILELGAGLPAIPSAFTNPLAQLKCCILTSAHSYQSVQPMLRGNGQNAPGESP